jgi:glycosyltransferase involved in cell wall biosynthesis
MRICHLNPFYFPYAGGIERRIQAAAGAMADRHDVHIVTADLPETEPGTETTTDGVTIHRLPSRFPFGRMYNPPPVITQGLTRRLRQIAPDVIDFHFRWSPSYNRAFRGLEGAARVATYHNTWGEGQGALGAVSRLNDRLYARTLDRADRVVAVSDFIRDDLIDHGTDAQRIRVVPNGVDAGSTHAPAAPETDIAGPYVLSIGRLVGVKGLDVAVDAMVHAPDDLHLVLVGKGPAAGALARRAQRNGVADRVHLTGWVPEDEKRRLLGSALAYVHPARFEAFGLSVLEAMAAGCPPIAARVGGLPQVVGDAGILLDHDPRAWAAAIGRLHASTTERDDLAAKARRRAAGFDWRTVARDLEAVYEEAVHA